MRVETYELHADSLVRVGEAASLAAASAALPHGAYTSLRTYSGTRVLRLAQHARRLEESLALQGTPAAIDPDRLREAIGAALKATRHAESRLRVTFAPPRLFVSVEPFGAPPPRVYSEGVRCVTVPFRRENPHSKDTRFIAAAAGTYRDLPVGVEEALMLAEDGSVLEGLSSNFFAVLAGELRTEEARVLHGVTRALVLEVAEGLLPIARRAVGVAELAAAAECFITSVSREVMPVVRVDERAIGDGRPGPVTREIAQRYAALAEREAEAVA